MILNQSDLRYLHRVKSIRIWRLFMYDSHIYCNEYKDLRDYIADIMAGAIEDYDIDKLSNHIQDLYDDGRMSSSQYDNLMGYIQDLTE